MFGSGEEEMNIDQYYMELKNKLSNRPILLDNTDDFLFVLENTVKAMIEILIKVSFQS